LKSSDYVVGQVWGRKSADKFLLDQVRGQMDCPTTIDAIRKLSTEWPLARTKLVEDKANGSAVMDHFGKNRLVTDLVSEDFAALRASIAKTRGPVALGNEMGRVRVVFKFAKDNRLVPEDVIYGSE